jgi:polyphosphate kinase
VAIKQTLYRTSGDSPIVEALIAASRNGKQVTALVELKARFDEMNNIHWARQLEEEGVHVVYGLLGLKTHCKCCLVVRREQNGLRRYAHLGTGNYNPKTARIYTDFSVFTAHPALTEEVADVFNALTGFALKPKFHHLLVAPFNLHAALQKKILREAAHAAAGQPARIIAKINSLVDQETMDNLYRASRAGVKIDLVIRGICGLVPGLKGLSENIRVTSVVGRFLEHSRIYYFENAGAEPEVYLGSADWMPRNFYRRIEVVFPVLDHRLRRRLIEDVLPAYLRDNAYATQLQPNGAYAPVPRAKDEPLFSVQEYFIEQAQTQTAAETKAADQAREKPALRPPPAEDAG